MVESIQQKTTPGFSARFNELLDRAGAPKKGRENYISTSVKKCSTASSHKWLKKDIVPRELEEIVIILISGMSGTPRLKSVMDWLLNGTEEANPFGIKSYQAINHILLSAIYGAVHNTARAQGIDIEKVSTAELTSIYDNILRVCFRYKQETPDEKLIHILIEPYNNNKKKEKVVQDGDHDLWHSIYTAVDVVAKEEGIKINTVPSRKRDSIYNAVKYMMDAHKSNKPDDELIADLLSPYR